MIRFLTGASNRGVVAVAHSDDIGLAFNPDSGYAAQLAEWPYWAAENGCFAQGQGFDLTAWLDWLGLLRDYAATCLYVVAPDTWDDGPATIARSLPVLPQIRALGYPAALVAQTGTTAAMVPWDAFDVLFLGGPNAWQYSDAATALVQEARRRGKWVHRGRVNSLRRLRDAALIGCDSADGTFLRYGPDVNLPRLRRWLRSVREQPHLPLWEKEEGNRDGSA